MRFRTNPFLRIFAPIFIRGARWQKFINLPPNMQACDLRHGIPFENSTVDVVYHSHFLEHLDRDIAPQFLREALRVLRSGGVHRIAVPDFEPEVRAYMKSLEACIAGNGNLPHHDGYVSGVLWGSVLREAIGTSKQKGWRRWLENKILGDARKRGHTHQWMYDRINLPALLKECGYDSVDICTFNRSNIADWNLTGLDINPDGSEYRPGTLYVEARKA